MNASELFPRLSPALAAQVLGHLQTAEKPAYQMAISTLAGQRKLRPVFVERKPREERYAWLQTALGRPQAEPIAANVIQMWLMGTQGAMLCDFLDALGIAHDANGGIETLPPAPPAERVQAAVDTLCAKYPRENVAVYLHSFQMMDIAGWSSLGKILEGDERMRL